MATDLRSYAKFMPKRKLPCYLAWTKWLAESSCSYSYIYSYRSWDMLMLQVITLMYCAKTGCGYARLGIV